MSAFAPFIAASFRAESRGAKLADLLDELRYHWRCGHSAERTAEEMAEDFQADYPVLDAIADALGDYQELFDREDARPWLSAVRVALEDRA